MNSDVACADHDDLQIVAAPDRRGAPRSLTAYRVVKIAQGNQQGLARCRNISDTGMKLDVNMPLSLGQALSVELSPQNQITGRVVWTNGEQCGLAFDREIDCARLLSDSAIENSSALSRKPRLPTEIPAQLTVQGRSQPTTITNISQQGMRVTHEGDFKPGLYVTVLLPDGKEKNGLVQWAQDNYAGLYLFDHFSVTELGDVRTAGNSVAMA